MASAKFKESSEDREQSFNGKTDGENVGLINEPLLMDLVKRCLDNIYSGKSHGKEKCSVCREGTLKGCSKCKTRYCSIHCQMTDFQSHKVKCQKSKMNTFGSSCPDSQTNEGMNHGEGAAKENYINSKKIGINNERVNNNTQMDTRKNWTAQPNCMNKEKSGNQKSTEECNVKESKDEDKRKRRLKKGESYEVEYIDCVRKDHTYIVFPTELREEFDNLHKILEEKHTKFSPVDEIVVGKTYAVNFKNKWFRGKAIRSGNKTSVRLIDRGFFCSPKTESFRELPNELRCILPMTAMIVFRKPYAKFTKCNIKVVSYEKNGVCVVEACEDSEEVEKMPNVPNLERRKENLNHFGSTSTISSNEKPPEDFDKSVENVSSGSLPFRSCSFTDLKEGQTAQFHLMKSEIDGNGNTLYGCLIPQPEEVDVLVTRKTSLTSKPFKQIRGQVRDFVVVHVPCSGGISPFCGIVTSIDNDKYTVFLVDGGYYATFENVYEVPEEECYNTKDLACKLTVKKQRKRSVWAITFWQKKNSGIVD
ncbi:UNVERIFIED_CONTAM: hypothetical protein PYX00_007388 [Menopon gallinae]|uniref:Tudor domain-containing protein 1 n=1 Tax=Menopon gallinae TaxID=328185 RepID=A0AAW2HIK0_9NEOP